MNIANRVLDELYFITTTVVDWVDIFTRPKYKHIILESVADIMRDFKKFIGKRILTKLDWTSDKNTLFDMLKQNEK